MPSKQPSEQLKTGFSRVLGGSAFLFLCRIGGAAATFLTQLLLARWMGASELGSYVLAFAWMNLLAAVPAGGYNAAAVRFIGQGLARENYGYASAYARHAVDITLISGSGIALLGVGAIALVAQISIETQMLFYAAIASVPFYATVRINSGVAMATSHFALGYLPGNVVRPTVFLILVWLVWLNDFSLNASLAMQLHFLVLISLTIATAVLGRVCLRELRSPGAPVKDSRNWNRAAMPLLGVSLFTNYFQQITVIVSGFFLASADIGVYNVAYRIAMLISFVMVAVDAFSAPALSRHYHRQDRVELVKDIQQATFLRFGISLAAVVFLVLFGEWVLSLFGPEFVEGYTMTVLLALAQLAHAAVGPVTRLLAISGHQKSSMYVSGASLALWLVLTAILMPFYGVLGVAIAVFIALTTWAVVLRQLVVWHLKISVLVLVKDLDEGTQVPTAASAGE